MGPTQGISLPGPVRELRFDVGRAAQRIDV